MRDLHVWVAAVGGHAALVMHQSPLRPARPTVPFVPPTVAPRAAHPDLAIGVLTIRCGHHLVAANDDRESIIVNSNAPYFIPAQPGQAEAGGHPRRRDPRRRRHPHRLRHELRRLFAPVIPNPDPRDGHGVVDFDAAFRNPGSPTT